MKLFHHYLSLSLFSLHFPSFTLLLPVITLSLLNLAFIMAPFVSKPPLNPNIVPLLAVKQLAAQKVFFPLQ